MRVNETPATSPENLVYPFSFVGLVRELRLPLKSRIETKRRLNLWMSNEWRK